MRDIRILTEFPRNLKVKRLGRKIGPDTAIATLIRLWCLAGGHLDMSERGDLSRFTPDEIEDEAGWTGEPGALYAALTAEDTLFIGPDMCLHDWLDNQPFAATAKKRHVSATKAAQSRWGSGGKQSDLCNPHTTRNATRNAPSFPSSPSLPSLPTKDEDIIPAVPAETAPPKKSKPTKKQYGQFNNVLLSQDEYDKLIGKFGEADAMAYIERISMYCASKGKRYKDYYATVLAWERKDALEGKGHRSDVSERERAKRLR